MGREVCDGWVRTLDEERVQCTGVTHVDGDRWFRRELHDAILDEGGTPIPSDTRSSRTTVLVQGDLSAARVIDPINVRSIKAVYADEQRRRGNHVCIIDDDGIAGLLLRDEPARCLRSRVVHSDLVELRS
jgi:hypothetical protein